MAEHRKRRFTWSRTETLLVTGLFVVFVVIHMASKWIQVKQGHISHLEQMHTEGVTNARLLLVVFLDALSQFLTPINLVLSVVVIYGILGVQSFIAGLRRR
jgi:uncharacterized membrane protein